ncbi:MAG: ABC transporter ATP-binding protein [Planctomycetes bacterium]|nr:ABC transporter ATP-binding protein [Planctomycetota bacterium]
MSRSTPAPAPVLEARRLAVRYHTSRGPRTALRGVDLVVFPGEVLGVVGESGSGKSSLLGALIRLLPPEAEITADRLVFAGTSVLDAAPAQLRALRGAGVATIFQDPRASLNPALRVGLQIAEVARCHQGVGRKRAAALAVEALARVGMPEPAYIARAYPHTLSGGMCQRVMIAMALVGQPRVLLADEPTTALDVRAQAGILDLLRALAREHRLGIVLVSHDLRVIGEIANRVMVLKAGRIVEHGLVHDVLGRPQKAYTRKLVSVVPRLGAAKGPIGDLEEAPVGAGGAEWLG